MSRQQQFLDYLKNERGLSPRTLAAYRRDLDRLAREMDDAGIAFGTPKIDIKRLLRWKQDVVSKLTGGLAGLARQRKVAIATGVGALSTTTTWR